MAPHILALLVLVGIAVAAPSPPVISETFSTNVLLTVKDMSHTVAGKGIWANDQMGNKAVESYVFNDATEDVFSLQRYDLGESFNFDKDEMNRTVCHEFKVSGTLPKTWAWVTLAEFVGEVNNAYVWQASIGYANLTLGVSLTDTTMPLFLTRNARGERETTYNFQNWNTTTPDASVFNVPSACQNGRRAFLGKRCLAGSTAVANAKVWVDNHVPYNQGGTYQGYREDCSGYVSMAWESSKPGHTTETMNEIAHQIAKDDLQPGDCLLYAAEHVVLFAGWTNADHSEYQAYEETKPGEGTVTRPTPYPYWYDTNMFLPFRYNDIC